MHPGLMGLIPGAESFGKKPGPMGLRKVSPEAIQKIMRLRQELGEQQASGAIPVVAGSVQSDPTGMGLAAKAAALASGGAEQGEQAPPQREPLFPTLPEVPSPMAFGQPLPPVSAPIPQEAPQAAPEAGQEASLPAAEVAKDPGTDPRFMRTPMHAMAESGAESRIYRNLRYDPEFADSILWKASSERRKYFAEHRCAEIDWSSLFTSFDIRQSVVLWKTPKDIVVTFRTMSAEDEVAVRRVLSRDFAKTDADYEVGTIITTVAAGLVSIMSTKLPDLPPPQAKIEDRVKVMDERMNFVLRLPYTMLTDIAINYAWFIMRVSDAQRAGELGNG